jgi:hypothetical protein
MNAMIYIRPRYLRARQRVLKKKQHDEQLKNQSSVPKSHQQEPELSEQQSSSLSGNCWLSDLFCHAKHRSSEEYRAEAGQWQALLSAVSGGGDDDKT